MVPISLPLLARAQSLHGWLRSSNVSNDETSEYEKPDGSVKVGYSDQETNLPDFRDRFCELIGLILST
jgi:hypothetical protein